MNKHRQKLLQFVAVAATMFLSGCASVDVTKLEMTDWKKVAVVVASDGYLHAQKVGTTAFNNSSAEWRPQDIDVDARIAAAIAPVLEEFSDWEVVILPDSRTIRDVQREGVLTVHPAFVLPEGYLESLHNQGFDGLIIYTDYASDDTLGGTNQWIRGVGVYYRSFMGMSNAHAVMSGGLRMYDLDHPQDAYVWKWIFKNVKIPDFEWPQDWSSLAPETREKVDRALDELLGTVVPDAVRQTLKPAFSTPRATATGVSASAPHP